MRFIIATLLAAGASVGGYTVHGLVEREPQPNECHVTREGSRPGEVQREYWQTWLCEDGYEFTTVWGQRTLTNMIWNLPEAP